MVLIDHELNMNYKHNIAVRRAKVTLGSMNSNIVSTMKEGDSDLLMLSGPLAKHSEMWTAVSPVHLKSSPP